MLEIDILKVLKEKKLLNIDELAKAVDKPVQDVRTVVERMEGDGLVKILEVLGPASVVLTAEGEAYLLKRMG